MRILCIFLSLLLPTVVAAEEEPGTPEAPELQPLPTGTLSIKDRFYVGGWLGASYGDVISTIQVAPELGFILVPKFHLGGGLVYRYRKDERFEPDLSTTDLGGSFYGRYFVYAPFFLQGGIEQLSWEYPAFGNNGMIEVTDADYTAVLLGPGFAISMGPRAATYMTLLYDVNYKSDEPNPYDRPWMIRIGVGIGL